MRSLLAVFAFLALLLPVAAQDTGPVVDTTQLMTPGPLGDMTLGDPKAPVTVIEYASMTCPHCGRFHSDTFPSLKSKYIDTGKAYFIFREFPLDPLAFAAFMLARCAAPDQYFAVIDTLFDNQEQWVTVNDPVGALQGFMAPFGLDMQKFQDCINNQSVFDHVNQVKERGADVFGVQGTPTFFFNGHRVVGEFEPADLDQIMDDALNEAAGGGESPAPIPAPGGGFTPSTQL